MSCSNASALTQKLPLAFSAGSSESSVVWFAASESEVASGAHNVFVVSVCVAEAAMFLFLGLFLHHCARLQKSLLGL